MPRDSLSPNFRRQRCKKSRRTQNIRTSTISLSSDSEPEEIEVSSRERRIPCPLNVTIEMEINGVGRRLNLENVGHSSINFYDNIESDINQFNSRILSDLIENDFPIEYHDQTLDITADDEIEYVDLCSGTKEKNVSTPPSTSKVPAINTECPVCLEDFNPLKPMYSTFCGHIFCKDCIFQVLGTSKKCPNCRKAITKSKVHPLFLN